MKITNRPAGSGDVKGRKSSGGSGRTERRDGDSFFEEALLGAKNVRDASGVGVDPDFIQEKMSELDELGRQLERAPSMKTFLAYRSAVQKLVSQILPPSLGISKTMSPVNLKTLEAKEYHTVQILNEELASLMSLVREKELRNMEVAGRVLRIKGLLVDVLR